MDEEVDIKKIILSTNVEKKVKFINIENIDSTLICRDFVCFIFWILVFVLIWKANWQHYRYCILAADWMSYYQACTILNTIQKLIYTDRDPARVIIEIYSVHFVHLMFSPSEGCPVLLVAAIVAPEQHNPQPVAALQPQLAISLLPPRLSLSVRDSWSQLEAFRAC